MSDVSPELLEPARAAPSGTSVPARGTMQLLVARLAFVASGFAVSVILGRGLGREAYGTYGVYLSVLVWLEMSCNAGLQGAAAKRVQEPGGARGRVESSAALLQLLVSTAVFLVLLALAPAIAGWLDVGVGAMRLALVDLPLAGLYFAYQGLLNGYRRFGRLAIGLGVYALTKLAGILFLLVIGLSVERALVVNILATVGGILFFAARGRLAFARPSARIVRQLVLLALPMGAYLVLSQLLLYVDLWLFKSWGAAGELAGDYNAAQNFARALGVVPSALSGVVFASLAGALARGDEALARHHVRAGGRFAVLVLLPAAVFAAMNADEVVGFVYGEKYARGGLYLSWLVFLFACAGVLDAYAHALMAAGRQAVVAAWVAGGVVVALVAARWAIPAYGGVGAAGSSLAGVAFVTLGLVAACASRFGGVLPPSTLLRVLAATAITAPLAVWIPAEGPAVVLELALLCVVYALLLLVLGELSREDLRRVLPW